MVLSVRAVYHDGQLHLLEPVDLTDGQTVNLIIQSDEEQSSLTLDAADRRLREAGLLVEIDLPDDAQELTLEERARIGALFVGDRPSEALIDEDRGLY